MEVVRASILLGGNVSFLSNILNTAFILDEREPHEGVLLPLSKCPKARFIVIRVKRHPKKQRVISWELFPSLRHLMQRATNFMPFANACQPFKAIDQPVVGRVAPYLISETE